MSQTYLRCCKIAIKGLWLNCPVCGVYLNKGDDRFKPMPDLPPYNDDTYQLVEEVSL